MSDIKREADPAVGLDVARLIRALASLDDGGCGDVECCGYPRLPEAAEIARAYDALGPICE